ncbi:hypothetical protein AHF37_08732 [Paragonimus kellicotti]|nr:hypothetical protein AHF37_08732 [Paragonimus kellicotti]
MPFGGNKWDQEKLVSYNEMMDKLRASFPFIKRISTESSSTAKVYQIENWPGKIGFITSMTNNFCAGCTRLRLTADGHLKPCLHGTDEVDLISVLRKANLDTDDLQSPSLFQCLGHEQESSSLRSVVKQLNILVDAALNRKAKEHSAFLILKMVDYCPNGFPSKNSEATERKVNLTIAFRVVYNMVRATQCLYAALGQCIRTAHSFTKV